MNTPPMLPKEKAERILAELRRFTGLPPIEDGDITVEKAMQEFGVVTDKTALRRMRKIAVESGGKILCLKVATKNHPQGVMVLRYIGEATNKDEAAGEKLYLTE